MKIKTCFFILILGLCNLLKGYIPSLQEVKDKITGYHFFDSEEIEGMCKIQEDGFGFTAWQITFGQIRNSNFEKLQQIEILSSLLMLGVLQIRKVDKDLFDNIEVELNRLKRTRKNHPEDFEKANLGFTLEELEGEFNKRCAQARNRIQMRKKEISSERTNYTKKRKRTEIEPLKP